MQALQTGRSCRPCRPAAGGRRKFTPVSSLNGAGPSSSRPGGGASRFQHDDIPSDLEGDVPTIAVRPSGGAFRGLPTPTPGTAGAVGEISFSRPGGGGTRFNFPPPPPTMASSGPSSSDDTPSRLSRPAGGGARMFPNGVGGGDGGPSGGGGGGGGGGSSGSGSTGAEEPIGLSSLAPWALLYVGICAGLFAAHELFLKKKVKEVKAPAAPAPAAAAPVKSCCKGKKK